MKATAVSCVVLMSLAALGCSKGKSDGPAATTAAAPTATTPPPAATPSAPAADPVASAAPAPSGSDLPTEEQYEKQAAASLDKSNAATELTKIEKEIKQ
jgi:hypothetical protein